MINPGALLSHFETCLLQLGIRGVDSRAVNTGGEPFRPAGGGLWFEIRAEPGDAVPGTETLHRRFWTVTVTASHPPGIGLDRGYSAAEKAAGLYVPYDPRLGAFQIGASRFYVLESSVGAPRAEGGAIRVPVTFRLLAVTPSPTPPG